MDPISWLTILIAVGTGVAGNAVYAALRASWSYLPVNKDPVRKSIAATWEGHFKQIGPDGKEETFPLTIVLTAGRKTVKGKATYKSNGADVPIDLLGGFVDARRLILSYKNADPAKLQHGELILNLSNDAAHLDGAFVGLGVATNKIGSGSVQLTKKA